MNTLHWGPHGSRFILYLGNTPATSWSADEWPTVANKVGTAVAITGALTIRHDSGEARLSGVEAQRFLADFMAFAAA